MKPMHSIPRHVWAALEGELGRTLAPARLRDRLGVVQRWLAQYYAMIVPRGGDPRLDWIIRADLDAYPTADDEGGGVTDIERMVTRASTSKSRTAAQVVQVFHAALTPGTGHACPRCRDAELGVLWDIEADRLVWECALCTWVQLPSGESIRPGLVWFPTKRVLERLGVTGGPALIDAEPWHTIG